MEKYLVFFLGTFAVLFAVIGGLILLSELLATKEEKARQRIINAYNGVSFSVVAMVERVAISAFVITAIASLVGWV